MLNTLLIGGRAFSSRGRKIEAMGIATKTVKWAAFAFLAAIGLVVAYYSYLLITFDTKTLPENQGRVNKLLYLGEGASQPLLVGFGGAEGGNAWVRNYLKPQRDRFLAQGYAFLAVAYFGEEGIPSELDRISLEGVYAAIAEAANHPKVNRECIALIGGSKGAELALVLASRYPDIKAVVGIVPANAVFAAHTIAMNTSSFNSSDDELPFVPVPWSAVPSLVKNDLRGAWEEMLEDEEAVERAAIPVEKINGPILLLSATRDEFWPSTEMSEAIVRRLEEQRFPYRYEHVAIAGGHQAPQERGDLIEEFLRINLLEESAAGCPR
jgi:pimeloyl-ACP methyl ester carboxylesterase